MVALFGEGRHPDADAIEAAVIARGAGRRRTPWPRPRSGCGSPGTTPRRARSWSSCPAATGPGTSQHGRPRDGPVPPQERARIRTEVGAGDVRAPSTAGPRWTPGSWPGSSPGQSRPATTAVAGYDLTFSPVKSVVDAVGDRRPRPGRRADRGRAPRRRRGHPRPGWSRTPPTPGSGRSGVRQVDVQRPDRRRRSPTATPAPATRTCTPTSRSANKVQDRSTGGGWPWTGGCCSRPPSPRPSGTTPASRPSCTDRLGRAVQPRDAERADAGKRPVREIVGVARAS